MGSSVASRLLEEIWSGLQLPARALERVTFEGAGALPSAFPVTDLAVASIGAAALAVSELIGLVTEAPSVSVDRRFASLWFQWSLRTLGWEVPPPWDPIAGDYPASDRWIRLHTNAPKHRAAALRVLGCAEDRDAVAKAVAAWQADALEQAIVDQGGCAAAMRSQSDWADHPQGRAVAREPVIALARTPAAPTAWRPSPDRPLAGLRVLDLTRVLAGPVATRFLAGYGADVLRIDPPDWNEPGVVPEVTLGKRCARLDLTKDKDRATFEALLADADILVHGYRRGALDGLGYGETKRRALRPGLIEVALDAYGWSGPWAGRRGFDSLVQMTTGLADAGMRWRTAEKPVPLPVQALDQATGYLMAAAAVRGVIARISDSSALTAHVSLARTAGLLGRPDGGSTAPFEPAADGDYDGAIETTDWGPANRIRSPATIGGARLRWDRGASDLGSAAAAWLGRSAGVAL
jgi:CoA-transferase family III